MAKDTKKKKSAYKRPKALPSRIYSYGADAPIENADLALKQLRLANRYRAALVGLELNRRKRVAKILRELSPELVKVQEQIAELDVQIETERASISKTNSSKRRRSPDSKAKGKVGKLKKQIGALRKREKALKTKLFASAEWKRREVEIEGEATEPAEGKKKGRRIDGWHGKKLKAIRRVFTERLGLYWGTYLAVEATVKRSGPPPRIRRWDGTGRLAVQIQSTRPLSVSGLLGMVDKRLAVERREDGVWIKGKRRDKKLGDAVLSFQVSGTPNMACKVPFVMHRDLPDAADVRVTWCYLLRRRIGTHFTWHVQFVMSSKDGWSKGDAADADGEVGIDIGWRVMDDGVAMPESLKAPFHPKGAKVRPVLSKGDADDLAAELAGFASVPGPLQVKAQEAFELLDRHLAVRELDLPLTDQRWNNVRIGDVRRAVSMVAKGRLRVAVWRGSDGAEGELALPLGWTDQYGRTEGIQSKRDDMNAAKEALGVWVKKAKRLPGCVEAARASLHAWRSPRRLASLALRWRKERVPGDDAAFEALEAWRHRDRHLLEFQANLRDQLQTGRAHLYREFSAMIRRRYATAIIEGKSKIDEKHKTAREDKTPAKRLMDLRKFHEIPPPEAEPGGVGEKGSVAKEHVRDACLSSLRGFLGESVTTSVVPAPGTTHLCNACKSKQTWDQSVLMHECSHCGTLWDQDRNAAANLLGRTSSETVAASV
jgi:hypothetical protein